MYRFLVTPRWIGFHVLVVVGIITMIGLGLWQLRRLDERQAFNATVAVRYDADPVPIASLLADDVDQSTIEWRPVDAVGEYLPDETVHVVNRFQNGRAGDNVVVPLRLDTGALLLVNRGFVPLGVDVPPAPTGRVEVSGWLRATEEREFGELSDPAEGRLTAIQRIDIPRLTPQLGTPVEQMYIDLASSSPAEPSAVERVLKPDLSEGPHRSYAIQWFIFSVCVAIGWVLAVRRSMATRRRESQPEVAASSA